MASSSRTSSGSSQQPDSGELRTAERRQKRMLSNRESARRSRMRKQKHLDELTAQVAQLKRDNTQILATLNLTTQHYLSVEAENSVLRTQMMELSHRLQSLNEILHYMNFGSAIDVPVRPWGSQLMSHQPIMASMDMFQYC